MKIVPVVTRQRTKMSVWFQTVRYPNSLEGNKMPHQICEHEEYIKIGTVHLCLFNKYEDEGRTPEHTHIYDPSYLISQKGE